MKATPVDGGMVWLNDSWARVAHSADGVMNVRWWATECGLRIQETLSDGRVHENGSLIRWGSLNHDVVRPCRRCFRP